MELTSRQKTITRNLGVSETEFVAAHAKRVKIPYDAAAPRSGVRWGDEGAPEPRFESHGGPEAFSGRWPKALAALSKVDDTGDSEPADETDVEDQVDRARNHLDARAGHGDSVDPYERLIRAAGCLIQAIEMSEPDADAQDNDHDDDAPMDAPSPNAMLRFGR